VISAAVEGTVDEAIVRRIVGHVGGVPGPIYGRNGKAHLRQRLQGYNNAARLSPWLVLIDLNHDETCPPLLRQLWLPHPSLLMCFRIAVREIESWLLADRQRLAEFLRVATSRIPSDPESVDDPKRSIVNIAFSSPRREIREDMVPRSGSGRTTGPAYDSRLIEFVQTQWRPTIAAKLSQSLRRCLDCLRRLVKEDQ
jgi:hypothetical protein